MSVPFIDASAPAIPIIPVAAQGFDDWLKAQPAHWQAWVSANGFKASPDSHLLIPAPDGTPEAVLFGVERFDTCSLGALPSRLGAGSYRIDLDKDQASNAAVAWGLGAYRFDRYRRPGPKFPQLVWPANANRAEVTRIVKAVHLVRDLVNTPSSDMGPAELADIACDLARRHKAKIEVTVGDDLLAAKWPAVHAVGRASNRAPRMVDMTWGRKKHPQVTLIGKGVCFDTGGLDIKPSGGMLLMKKDMGGAAHALALADMIMDAELPVRLRVLVPAVENAISGNAFRPLDILHTRKGTTVEIGNTDAEGRLILADALAAAVEDRPDMILDFATLTGAARVALGPEIAVMFSNDDALAAALVSAGELVNDPVWRLPLHQSYRRDLKGKLADLNNIAGNAFAGAIYAALFLQHFVDDSVPWAHFDITAWNFSTRPGRPEGGEAMALRAAWQVLCDRYRP